MEYENKIYLMEFFLPYYACHLSSRLCVYASRFINIHHHLRMSFPPTHKEKSSRSKKHHWMFERRERKRQSSRRWLWHNLAESHRDGRDDDDGKYCKNFYVFRIVVAIVLPIRLLRLSMREGKERKKTLRWRYFSCMRLSTNKCAEKLQQNPLTERPAHTHRHTVNAHVHTATKREDFQEGERSHLAFDLHSQSWTREREMMSRGDFRHTNKVTNFYEWKIIFT